MRAWVYVVADRRNAVLDRGPVYGTKEAERGAIECGAVRHDEDEGLSGGTTSVKTKGL
jgi:hypothetical protein